LCVNPEDVHWIQGVGLPNAFTVGRNTLVTGWINNFDVALAKSFELGESRRVEFRWEAFNALNRPQFTQIPEAGVVASPTSHLPPPETASEPPPNSSPHRIVPPGLGRVVYQAIRE
jgi:hypothetical protein